jgi:hypothetical protein
MLEVTELTMVAYIGPGEAIPIPQLALIATGLLILALLVWRVMRKK